MDILAKTFCSALSLISALFLASCGGSDSENKPNPLTPDQPLHLTLSFPTPGAKLGGITGNFRVSGTIGNAGDVDIEEIESFSVNESSAVIDADTGRWYADVQIPTAVNGLIAAEIQGKNGQKSKASISVNNLPRVNFFMPKAFDAERNRLFLVSEFATSIIEVDLDTDATSYITTPDFHSGPQLTNISKIFYDDLNNRIIAFDIPTESFYAIDLSNGERSHLFTLETSEEYDVHNMAYDQVSNRVFLLKGFELISADFSSGIQTAVGDISEFVSEYSSPSLVIQRSEDVTGNDRVIIFSHNPEAQILGLTIGVDQLYTYAYWGLPLGTVATYTSDANVLYVLTENDGLIRINLNQPSAWQVPVPTELSWYHYDFEGNEAITVDPSKGRLLFYTQQTVKAFNVFDDTMSNIHSPALAGSGPDILSPRDVVLSNSNAFVLEALYDPYIHGKLYSINLDTGTKQIVSDLSTYGSALEPVPYAHLVHDSSEHRFFLTTYSATGVDELILPNMTTSILSDTNTGDGDQITGIVRAAEMNVAQNRIILLVDNQLFAIEKETGHRTIISGLRTTETGEELVGTGPNIELAQYLDVNQQSDKAFIYCQAGLGFHIIEVDLETGNRSTLIYEPENASLGYTTAFAVDSENMIAYVGSTNHFLASIDLLSGEQRVISSFYFEFSNQTLLSKMSVDTTRDRVYAVGGSAEGGAIYAIDVWTGTIEILAD